LNPTHGYSIIGESIIPCIKKPQLFKFYIDSICLLKMKKLTGPFFLFIQKIEYSIARIIIPDAPPKRK